MHSFVLCFHCLRSLTVGSLPLSIPSFASMHSFVLCFHSQELDCWFPSPIHSLLCIHAFLCPSFSLSQELDCWFPSPIHSLLCIHAFLCPFFSLSFCRADLFTCIFRKPLRQILLPEAGMGLPVWQINGHHMCKNLTNKLTAIVQAVNKEGEEDKQDSILCRKEQATPRHFFCD